MPGHDRRDSEGWRQPGRSKRRYPRYVCGKPHDKPLAYQDSNLHDIQPVSPSFLSTQTNPTPHTDTLRPRDLSRPKHQNLMIQDEHPSPATSTTCRKHVDGKKCSALPIVAETSVKAATPLRKAEADNPQYQSQSGPQSPPPPYQAFHKYPDHFLEENANAEESIGNLSKLIIYSSRLL